MYLETCSRHTSRTQNIGVSKTFPFRETTQYGVRATISAVTLEWEMQMYLETYSRHTSRTQNIVVSETLPFRGTTKHCNTHPSTSAG